MRVPLIEWPITDWDSRLLERWTDLESKAADMSEAAGSNDAFDSAVAELRNMASTGQFSRLLEILRRRTVARALTWLWLNDEQFSSKMLNPRLLETLLEAQAPRFTRMTLQQLAQLYFRRFDQLDKQHDVRELLERILLQQLEKIPPLKIQSTWIDPLVTLKREAHWLLTLNGPATLAKRVQESGRELGATFQEMGLQGFDDGRYGDVCRAHFYLDTLRNLPVGASDPVFEELQKQSVAKAPFEGTRRIGHVALEILIDRSGQEASEAWQEFIINLAGDPRIASSALNYREWWQPLGEERIQKVRAWLSKEDLRLFLRAVEQYGIEAQNDELQRMFPARKIFLEGLFKLKLIRNTRLLLGSRASQAVKRILGKDVKTSFAHMDGSMNDKAVIYLDCGDFHLVEGSHSFKIWVYLAAPGDSLRSYEKITFSHFDLTRSIPADYKKLYPGLPFDGFVHTPGSWQNNVFKFLAKNGIELDVEALLSAEDYKIGLRRFGLPVVNPRAVLNRTAVVSDSRSVNAKAETERSSRATGMYMTAPASRVTPRLDIDNKSNGFSTDGRRDSSKKQNPVATAQRPSRHIIKVPSSSEEATKITVSSLPMAASVSEDNFSSVASDEASRLSLDLISKNKETGEPSAKKISDSQLISKDHSRTPRVSRLSSLELQVLRYFYNHPGNSARAAADFLSVETSKVYQIVSHTLKGLCSQNKRLGWKLTGSARLELDIFDEPVTSKISDTNQPTVKSTSLESSSLVVTDEESLLLDSAASDTEIRDSQTDSGTSRISRLNSLELQVLRYFLDNPGDKARYAADVLGVDRAEVNRILYGALKSLCRQGKEHGWKLTESARFELENFDQQG